MMIPMYWKTADFSEPSSSLYHLVAANGIFLVEKTTLFTSVTVAGTVPGLMPQEASISLLFPPLPRQLMEQVYGFFHAVYQRWAGEAVVFLYYAPERGSFRLAVPPQTVFRGRSCGRWQIQRRVVYGYLPRPPGFVKLGDVHSHADLPAFFSCTDDQDEACEEGLHLVLGKLHEPQPDISASFVSHGTRFILAPREVMEDFSIPQPPPPAWLEQVTCQEMHNRKVRDDEPQRYGADHGPD
jgi:hypothetical protein